MKPKLPQLQSLRPVITHHHGETLRLSSAFRGFKRELRRGEKTDCDVREKIAFSAFPQWKADSKRTNHAPSLDKWLERRATVTVSL